MKLSYQKKTGKCFFCGKSTQLLIHSGCGKDKAEKKEKVVKKWSYKKVKSCENYFSKYF